MNGINSESPTLYRVEIDRETLLAYVKRICAGIPFGLKADLGGDTHPVSVLYGVSIKEDDSKRNYLRYENDHRLTEGDVFRIVYGGVDNMREFGRVECGDGNFTCPLVTYYKEAETGEWVNDIVKPYLRPISALTDKEMGEAAGLILGGAPYKRGDGTWYTVSFDPCIGDVEQDLDPDYFSRGYYGLANVDFLNAHHVDYDGLIEKGMALEAMEGMYSF